jgi:hypothetical protein
MPTAEVAFHELIQDSQEYGSDDEHMVSRVFFSVEVDGKTFQGLSADVKQTVGSDIETAPLEVSSPLGYDGPWNDIAFAQAAEEYYRRLIGSHGSGIRIGGGSSNVRMWHNTIRSESRVSFPVSSSGSW